jgi:hypothetical protein
LQVKHFFDFKKDIDSGRIVNIAMPIEAIQRVVKEARVNGRDIHAGEAESIAALLASGYQELYFCTADRVAVAVAHLFDVMHRIVSFEKCLEDIKSYKLPYKLTETAMKSWKAEAIQRIG